MRRRGSVAAPLAVVLALGCGASSLLERPPPEKRSYALAPPAPAPAAAPLPGVLRVDRVRVSPLFDSKGFVYRTGESTWASDYYHEFFAPPGEIVREALLRGLAAAPFAEVQSGSLPRPDWTLAVEVEELYGDWRDRAAPLAVLSFEARLVDVRSARRDVTFQRRYREVEPVSDGSPQALVDAWSRSLGRALTALAADLHGAARTRASTPAR